MNVPVMNFRQPTLFCLLLGSMPMFSHCALGAEASGHIKVVKAILFESGTPADPHAIARTHDDGYVLAGSFGPAQAWATRISSDNRVVWRFVVPTVSGPGQTMESEYVGVVQLPDDSTLLCGSAITTTKDAPLKHEVGLLTVISKQGEVTAQTSFDPINGAPFRGNNIWKCIPYGDGALTVGTADRPVKGQIFGTPYVRMLTLDAKGVRIADRSSRVAPVFAGLNDITSNGREVVLLCGGDMHESGSTVVATTRLVRLDDAGATKGERTFRGAGYYLQEPDDILSIALVVPNGNTQVRKLDVALKDVSVVDGPPQTFYLSTRSYRLKDGSIVLFGQTEVGTNSYSDSVTWVDPTLHDKEVYMFTPLFTNDKVRAVTASGRPGEFVIAREVHPRGIPGSEKDPTGVMLTVVTVQ